MKKVFTFFLIFILLTISISSVLATEERVESPHEEHKVPLPYYLQWMALLFILIISLFFVYQVKKVNHNYDKKELAYILTFLAVLAFSLNYHPQIKEYHELPLMGLMKFLVAVADGALLTFYGVLGRHDENEETHQEVNPSGS